VQAHTLGKVGNLGTFH